MKRCYLPGLLIVFTTIVLQQSVLSQANRCAWIPIPKPGSNLPSKNNARFNSSLVKIAHANAANDTLYTLPVVVHVIHTGSPIGSVDNPADSLIMAMIQGLNNAWRKNGSMYGGVDMRIQFALAKRGPDCSISGGINRVDGSSISNYVSGGITNFNAAGSAAEQAVKKLSRWPNTDYINIWIVNKINGSSVFPGGYAYFPEYNSAITDGLVLLSGVVNGTNKTIAHEMGHYFNLYHTFYDDAAETTCAANSDCAAEGDRICDTEPCLLKYNCSDNFNSCTGSIYTTSDIAHGYTVLNNYMGYTDCQWMFTQGQKDRARDALLTFRNGLISSGGLNDPANLFPAVACSPVSVYGLSPYYGVQQFDFNTLHVYSNTSEADSSIYFDHTCNQSTTVEKGLSYPVTVTGSYFNPHRIKVFIDYNNNGSFADPGEMILSDYNGMASGTVAIPTTFSLLRVPLRIRVVADNPTLPAPGPCNITGTSNEGSGQVEDYAMIVVPKQIYSVASGQWNAPATWSCNCIPANDDEVTVKSNHAITLSTTAAQCGKLYLQTGSRFTGSKNLKLVGNN